MLQQGIPIMATLSHFPTFQSLSSHKPLFSPKPRQWLSWKTHEYPPRRNLKICAFSIKRPRRDRKVKSNEELCNDIREFVAAVGLPEVHVPSVKELSQHGRSDLANIVRRRGYKLIKKLLMSSPETDNDGFNLEKNVIEKHDATSDSADTFEGQIQKVKNAILDASLLTEVACAENNLIGVGVDSIDHNCMKENTMHTSGDQKKKEDAMVEDVSPSTFLSVEENYSGSLNANPDLNSDDNSFMPEESPPMSTLEEKVSKLVQNRDLDAIEYNVYGMLNESSDEERKEVVGTSNDVATQSRNNSQECSEHAYGAAITLNGSTKVAKQVAPPVAVNHLSWSHDIMEAQMLKGDDLREDLNSETTGRDNEIEINHLKFMLKELELSRLKEQIEKEENALSALQIKAETEIHKAQKLVSEKDAELHAAEKNLSGLEEVQIEYSGDGEIVEVAGSFNGWHHRIKMDPKPCSTITNPINSSKSKIWSTVLWLYPGIYEIKFIVDGQWKIDPQRESTTMGGICNNIFRVDGILDG